MDGWIDELVVEVHVTETCICYRTILPTILLSYEFRALPCLERVGSRPGTLFGTVVHIVHTHPVTGSTFEIQEASRFPALALCSFLCRTSARVRALYSTASRLCLRTLLALLKLKILYEKTATRYVFHTTRSY